MNLALKSCAPCREGAKAIPDEQAYAIVKELSGWTISDDLKWLEKSYKFKDFIQALAYVNKIGDVAEEQGHHPDIALGWGYVNIRLQTHTVAGLHENDFILAAKIENIQ